VNILHFGVIKIGSEVGIRLLKIMDIKPIFEDYNIDNIKEGFIKFI